MPPTWRTLHAIREFKKKCQSDDSLDTNAHQRTPTPGTALPRKRYGKSKKVKKKKVKEKKNIKRTEDDKEKAREEPTQVLSEKENIMCG